MMLTPKKLLFRVGLAIVLLVIVILISLIFGSVGQLNSGPDSSEPLSLFKALRGPMIDGVPNLH